MIYFKTQEVEFSQKNENHHDEALPSPKAIPPGKKQSNLTDPDSRLMRKSLRHEYRQAYNAQAAVNADGSQLVLTTDVGQTPSDQPLFQATIEGLMRAEGKITEKYSNQTHC